MPQDWPQQGRPSLRRAALPRLRSLCSLLGPAPVSVTDQGCGGALRRCAALLEGQSPDRSPEHHFYFNGNKLDLYTGTALAWLGDPAAEVYARHAAARHEASGQRRRLATAHLDLGLVLARLGRPDEAAHCGVVALGTNHLVPSNAWRADELVAAVSGYRGVPEVEELRELAAQQAER